MVRNCWAIAYRKYSNVCVADETFAKENKLGIWVGNFIEPYLMAKRKKVVV